VQVFEGHMTVERWIPCLENLSDASGADGDGGLEIHVVLEVLILTVFIIQQTTAAVPAGPVCF